MTTVLTSIDAGVATVTLNRPGKLNALTVELMRELTSVMSEVVHDEAVRCVILTGAGRAFCAGADMAALGELMASRDRDAGAKLVDGCRELYRIMRAARQPILCALNGAAAGGGANLALACDLRIAADTASIGQVFAKLGLHPDYGGSYFLPRLVGAAKAMEIFLDAEMIPAPKLLELGIVNRVVPAADLPAAAGAWAARIAAGPPHAMRLMKQSVYESERSSLDEMLSRELAAQLECFMSGDFTEGLAAFREKRAPTFTGR